MRSITATDLPRFMDCNGSRLMEGFQPAISDDTARNEGNAAHWLIQQIAGGHFAGEELIDRKAYNGVFIGVDMLENVSAFLEGKGRGGQIEYETTFRDPGGKWEVRSRADRIKYDNGDLYVDDFKYGWGVVEPENNWTLIAHAIGFISNNPTLAVRNIHFTIYQPRPHHPDGKIRTWTVTEPQLRMLYATLSETLTHPSDLLITNSHCGRCPAAVNCPAFRKAQMNAIDASEMAFNDKLENADLSYIYENIERAAKVLDGAQKAYKELMLHKMRLGEIMPNYSIENELSNRELKDFVTIDMVQAITGKRLTKEKLMTPKQMEDHGVPKEVVASFCERRNKGAKLVRISEDAKARKLFSKPKGE